MYSSQFYRQCSKERMFIYEVFLPSVRGSLIHLKVPFHQMSQKVKDISLQGGKIISITPANFSKGSIETDFAWWVEVSTSKPKCIYFFGPFVDANEAKLNEKGYLEDLQSEGAIGIKALVKYCQPSKFTIELD